VCGDGAVYAGVEACDDGNDTGGDGCENDCTVTLAGGCSGLATFEAQIAPDLWICSITVPGGKSWPQTYGACNEAGGFYLASVGPMTRRGLPSDTEIGIPMAAAAAIGHSFLITGQPTRSCNWTGSNYETCNGLGYIPTYEVSVSGTGWSSLSDGDSSGLREWPSANTTLAHAVASLCMNAASDPLSVIFDHRWR
jgi:cysteine-rich repeat protein